MGVLTEPLAPIFTGLNDGWPCGLLTKGFAIRLEVAAEPLLPDSYNGFIRKHCSNSTDLKNTSVVHSTPSSCIGLFCEVWSLCSFNVTGTFLQSRLLHGAIQIVSLLLIVTHLHKTSRKLKN